jgi:hypothetical protein
MKDVKKLLQEIDDAKQELENEISKLIKYFEIISSLRVEAIELKRSSTIPGHDVSVKVKVEL